MANAITNLVTNARGLSPWENHLLMVLANWANEHGVCWPSNQTLADTMCCSVATVQRAKRSLAEKGVLRIQHRFGERYDNHHTNLYTISKEALAAVDYRALKPPRKIKKTFLENAADQHKHLPDITLCQADITSPQADIALCPMDSQSVNESPEKLPSVPSGTRGRATVMGGAGDGPTEIFSQESTEKIKNEAESDLGLESGCDVGGAFEAVSVISQPPPEPPERALDSPKPAKQPADALQDHPKASRRSQRKSRQRSQRNSERKSGQGSERNSQRSQGRLQLLDVVPPTDSSPTPDHVAAARTLIAAVDVSRLGPWYSQMQQIETAVAHLVEAGHNHEQLVRYLRRKAKEANTVTYFINGCHPARVAQDLPAMTPPRAVPADTTTPAIPAQTTTATAQTTTANMIETTGGIPAPAAPVEPASLTQQQISSLRNTLIQAQREGRTSSRYLDAVRRNLTAAGIDPDSLLKPHEPESGVEGTGKETAAAAAVSETNATVTVTTSATPVEPRESHQPSEPHKSLPAPELPEPVTVIPGLTAATHTHDLRKKIDSLTSVADITASLWLTRE